MFLYTGRHQQRWQNYLPASRNLYYGLWGGFEKTHLMGVFEITSSAKQFRGILYNSHFSILHSWIFLLPFVGKQLFEVAVRIFRQALNDVGQIRPWFNAMAPTR